MAFSISAPHASPVAPALGSLLAHLHLRRLPPVTTMTDSSLLSFALLLAVASPLAAAGSVSCGGDGSYAANSTYEANLRRLAAVLPAEASAARGRYEFRAAAGYWPNRLQADSSCRRSSDSDCAACIADAFKRVERECPFHREAVFFSRHCSLRLGEFRIFGSDMFGGESMIQTMAPLMIFQAFGLACLFFLFLQAWRHDSKKRSIMGCTPISSGGQ